MHGAKALKDGIRVNIHKYEIPCAWMVMHAFFKKDFSGREIGGVSPRTLSYFFVNHTKK